MDEIEVDSIQDITIEVNDGHSRVSEDVEPIRHNLQTIKTESDSIIIKNGEEEILRITSETC